MFGFNDAPPQAQPQAAPPPPAPAQAGPAQPYQPSWWDVAQGMLFSGQSPADAAMAARSRQYQIQQNALLMNTLQHATPEQRQAMLFNGPEYGKSVAANFAPVQTSEGATQTMFGGTTQPGGYSSIAPKMMLGPAGQPLALTQNGAMSLGAQLPGAKSVTPEGAELDANLGLTGARTSVFHATPFSSSGTQDLPQIDGSVGQPAPLGGGGGAGPGSPSAPRGIRNNNFGNIRALPSGQQWNGQTGVDGQGYAVFATPEAGAQAARTNLTAYATRHGINTVAGAINRWAPSSAGNNTGAYAHYVAGALGVDPNQKIDLTDPKVQQTMLSAMFHFENGPEKMAAWRGGGQGGGVSRPAQSTTVAQARPYSIDTQNDSRLPPGAVVQSSPTGEKSIMPGTGYGPDQLISLRSKLNDEEPVKNWRIANTAYGAMLNSAAQPNGGMRAYALRDTFARLINPGAVARVGTIQAISESQGLPANIKGYLMNLKGDGNVPPEIAQQILDVSRGFLASHHAEAKSLNDNYGQFAQRHGVNPEDITVPVGDEPPRAVLGPLPSKDKLLPNTVYMTRHGPLKWTGTGFLPFEGR